MEKDHLPRESWQIYWKISMRDADVFSEPMVLRKKKQRRDQIENQAQISRKFDL